VITITRHQARQLRAVFRRAALGITHRGTIPPLVLHAEGTQLRAQYRYAALAVEHVEPGSYRPTLSLAIPLDALADFEGRDDAPVVLEAAASDRTVVRWQDRGIPQTRDYLVAPFGQLAPFPETPTTWASSTPELLTALAEATRTGTNDSTRYALNCIQLRGGQHQIVATDGRQMFLQSGFDFPWDGDVLIPGSPIFAGKALEGHQPIQIGKTETHVVLRIGPWTIWLEIPKDVRFPHAEQALPDLDGLTTRWQIEAQDAEFLKTALDRPPGADQPQVTELVLRRSRYTGSPIRIATDRAFLNRALGLGFREIAISGVESPVVCRNQELVYAWQPLGGDAAIPPTESVVRIESGTTNNETHHERTQPVSSRRSMSEPVPVSRNGQTPARPVNPNGETDVSHPGTSLAALIQEAEQLHTTLTDARSRLARLIAGLRRHRKQSRLLTETLKSLRQLKLAEAVE
jgi:hypothetical protein